MGSCLWMVSIQSIRFVWFDFLHKARLLLLFRISSFSLFFFLLRVFFLLTSSSWFPSVAFLPDGLCSRRDAGLIFLALFFFT